MILLYKYGLPAGLSTLLGLAYLGVMSMARTVAFSSIAIFTRLSACAHNCRYCCMGSKKSVVHFPLSRFAQLVERFALWRDRERPDLRLAIGPRYSEEADLNTMRELKRLGGILKRFTGRMHLGGLKIRSEQAYREWFQERYDLGWRFANASYAGTFEIHDGWNKRKGDFQHLLMLQTIAAETGYDLGQYMFVARNTLSRLGPLLDFLNVLPKAPTERSLIAFGYIGSARDVEDQRIGEQHRDALLDRFRPLMRDVDDWRSEREWIRSDVDTDHKSEYMLHLEADETTIEKLEAMDCGEIVDDLMRRTTMAYGQLPTWNELRDRCGDPAGTLVYAGRDDMERKWLDDYFSSMAMPVDLHLTHLRKVV
jgi:hypothetical protein